MPDARCEQIRRLLLMHPEGLTFQEIMSATKIGRPWVRKSLKILNARQIGTRKNKTKRGKEAALHALPVGAYQV